jgi:pimeloyl-ACP methyl ester carboxylesterase
LSGSSEGLITIPRINRRLPRTELAAALAAVLGVLALVLSMSPLADATSAQTRPPTAQTSTHGKPVIVLVHGAFADASGWSRVITRLQRHGYTVYAPANPLRSVSGDSAYLETFLATLHRPIVLVGHSYGGAVITTAAKGNADVKALVYIAAFALDKGETVEQASALGGGHNDLLSHIVLRPFGPGPTDLDAYIDPAAFRRIFAQDVRKGRTAVMAASQRPAALATLGEPSGPPAWKDIPSWYLVAKNDHTIPPIAERFMARRAGSTTIAIRSSHVAMISHPGIVTRLIRRAAH